MRKPHHTMIAQKSVFLSFLSSFTLFFVLLTTFSAAAQIEKTTLQNLEHSYVQAKNVGSLVLFLDKELSSLRSSNRPAAEIITNVLIAKKTAEERDILNDSSTILFKKALLKARQLKRADLELWVSVQYGFYLYTYRRYEDTYPLFMYAIRTLDKTPDEQVIQPSETYKKLSFFLTTVGDYEKADAYLIKAKTHAAPNSSELAAITDNLGINNIKQNKLVKAQAYLNGAKTIAENAKDKLRYAKVLGNMAWIKFKQKDYEKAIDLLNKDVAISKQVGNTQNTIYALVLMGKAYLANGNISGANQVLHEARVYAKSKTYLQSSDYEINTLILEIAKKTGNDQDELAARRSLEQLKQSLAHLDGKEVIVKVGWEMEKKNLQLNIQIEKEKREKETLQKIIALGSCFALIVVIIFVIRRYQRTIAARKTEYDEKIQRLSLDKDRSELKLKVNSQTIESYKTYLSEKNDQIRELQIEMANIKQSSPKAADKYADKMQQLLDSHLMTNEVWGEFKNSFIRSYPEYYQTLIQNFTDLTDTSLRFVFLSKLGMNNMQTARILGLTLEGVKKAKQRLRKKYAHASLFNESPL